MCKPLVVIPALDVLIGNPEIFDPKPDTEKEAEILAIPEHYVTFLTKFRDELSTRGEASQKILDKLSTIASKIHSGTEDFYVCRNQMKIKFIGKDSYRLAIAGSSNSQQTIAAAKHYADKEGITPSIMTGDSSMATQASLANFDVIRINPDVYTGRRKLTMDIDTYSIWASKGYLTKTEFENAFPDEPPLRLNEFVEFDIDPTFCSVALKWGDFIGRFNIEPGDSEPCLQKIHHYDLSKTMSPRNAGQAMYLDALMDPTIPIVICPSTFGTGKTFLAVGAGIEQVKGKRPRYDKILIVPRDAQLGREIGAVPGDETEKTLVMAKPIIDNVENYLKSCNNAGKGGVEQSRRDILSSTRSTIESFFEFTPIINMGGRSISDSWIIYDEAQDMERFQINQLMKRIGDGSKMIITGDPHQVFNPHMSPTSNGLSYAATKMAGSRYAVVVSFTPDEITRSEAAREIARRLDC